MPNRAINAGIVNYVSIGGYVSIVKDVTVVSMLLKNSLRI